jgi:hypothetical protein
LSAAESSSNASTGGIPGRLVPREGPDDAGAALRTSHGWKSDFSVAQPQPGVAADATIGRRRNQKSSRSEPTLRKTAGESIFQLPHGFAAEAASQRRG